MATGPQRSRAARCLDALLHRGPGYDLKTDASAVSLPPADQTTLRDRIAQALADEDARACGWGHEFLDRYGADAETDGFVDAVLAVLPATTDQTADERIEQAEADATPQADDALTLECSKLTCHQRAPLSVARETWIRPAGEYGWLCPDCAADFFQPGHTYRHSAWSFRCDLLTTHPDTGERVALGWFWFLEQRCRPFTAGAGHWRDGWRDITQPAGDSEPPAPAITDTPGEGT